MSWMTINYTSYLLFKISIFNDVKLLQFESISLQEYPFNSILINWQKTAGNYNHNQGTKMTDANQISSAG